jgi:hypothetical protein
VDVKDKTRRRLGIAFSVLALMGACTDTNEDPEDQVASVEPSTAEPTATPSPQETLDPTANCDGFGRAARKGEVTFISEGRLMAAGLDGESRCLVDLTGAGIEGGNVIPPTWNALADRVIVSNRALADGLTVTRRLTAGSFDRALWSRPTGTSVIYLTRDNRIEKRSSFGGKATDISFLERHDSVTYHPAGTHIATTGLEDDGTYGLYLATNVGTEPQLLAVGEAARFITNLHFSEDGQYLYYTARHGPTNWHLHRLAMGEDPFLDTLDMGEFDYTYAVSPFDAFRVAYFQPGDCAAGEPGTMKIEGFRTKGIQIPDEFENDNLIPIGWLPRGELVVARRPISCSTAAPSDIYVLSNDEPVLIVEEVGGSAALRMEMPEPPPPPGGEQEVVA